MSTPAVRYTAAGRLSAPSPAERARSLAERGAPELLCGEPPGELTTARVAPRLHHITGDGQAMLVLPANHPVSRRAGQPRRPLPAMLELIDAPSAPLVEPVRGLVWIVGWLYRLDRRAARRAAAEIAETRPDPALLDVNHSLAIVRLQVGMVILADGEGTDSLSATDFQTATPDPFCRVEAMWLHHLESHHPEVLEPLVRNFCTPYPRSGLRARPLGLDRYGLRVRLENDEGHIDTRLAFTRPAACCHELHQQLHAVLGSSIPTAFRS